MQLNKKLKTHWFKILSCQRCELPEGYVPQFRAIGNKYKPGGILFSQINPGHIGVLTDREILNRYKTRRNQEIAKIKAQSTRSLLDLQEKFKRSNSDQCWLEMCHQYRDAMRNIWGWPPGNFRKTIEAHNVDFDKVAIVNLAQCPTPNDKYRKCHLETCWSCFTRLIIELLDPKVIVAQGSQVYDFLQERYGNRRKIIRGVHHASRKSRAEKEEIYESARKLLSRI